MSRPSDRLKANTALVPIAYRPSFLGDPWLDMRPAGQTIEQIVRSIPELPDCFWARGYVCINGDLVPREMWGLVRPKPTSLKKPISVTLHLPPRGGGDSGGGAKAIVGLVAAVALTLATAGIASGLILPGISAALGASLGVSAGAGASILAGAVGLAGSLALSALSAPPQLRRANEAGGMTDDAREAASAEGNMIEPGGAIPRVIGTSKVFPSLASEPVTELVDEDEFVEAVYVLNGPHLLSDIRVGDAPIEDASDIESQTREGWENDDPQDLVTRQGRTSQLQMELSSHSTDSEDTTHLKYQSNPETNYPVWHSISTKKAPEEVWIHLTLPQGLSRNGDLTNPKSIPFRLRMRRRGDSTWRNLPEFHLTDAILSQRRRAILIYFQEKPDTGIPTAPSASGWTLARISSAGGTNPVTEAWTADSYFDNGGGGPVYLDRGREATTAIDNVFLYDNSVEIYLDPAEFVPGIWDIEIKRGATFDTSTYSASTELYSGNAVDFFAHQMSGGTAVIPATRKGLAESVYLMRVVSIWNEHPLPQAGLATIAIRARNRRVENVSTIASSYVKDWDGTGWNTWSTTSNPAAHYVDVLCGRQNLDPLPDDLRDDAGLVEWRTLCATNSWTVDAVVDDMRTQDVLQLIASCGYARPYQSEIYGVTIDRDTSAETPVQVFSPRNMRDFRWERAFARLPDGFVVGYRDAADDYNDVQTIVYREGYSGGDTGILESVNYAGLVDEEKVRTRAKFDLDQSTDRSIFYHFDAPIEAIVCRRGSLVGLQHDVLAKRTGSARIKRKVLSGSNITGLVLDSTVPVANEPDIHATTDLHAVTDIHRLGLKTGMVIRHSDGTVSTHQISTASAETDTVTLTTPVADSGEIDDLVSTDYRNGSLVVVGDLGSEYKRMLVSNISPAADLSFSLTLVDEAPGLVRGA